ncbi:MAG: hypothetical protein A4E35_01286 [Methanoregula sp. PtaU1.Bin051]|nr:MAG: hypothetical protein A4E35_01286 [Methanoregula sp. PtaU1.Bin051]
MTAMHRMVILEREAGAILRELGYEPAAMSDCFPHSNFIPYNLIATKKGTDGTEECLWVKLKASPHPIRSPEEAAPFCGNERKFYEKKFRGIPSNSMIRYEVWFSVPSDKFETFEITHDGIRQAQHPDRKPVESDGGPT